MAELNFNATTAPARQPRVSTPLPAGTYTAEITSADVKPLKSGRGTGLSLEFTVIDPEEHANRKVWQHINVKHESAQAEEIGLGELKELCDSIGIEVLKESDELFGKIVRIQTKVRAAQGDYPARTEVNGYMPAGVAVPKPAAPAPAAAVARPWQKSAA
jgi:Protein of unknown function (DUF669)